jgi:hypothetical protein
MCSQIHTHTHTHTHTRVFAVAFFFIWISLTVHLRGSGVRGAHVDAATQTNSSWSQHSHRLECTQRSLCRRAEPSIPERWIHTKSFSHARYNTVVFWGIQRHLHHDCWTEAHIRPVYTSCIHPVYTVTSTPPSKTSSKFNILLFFTNADKRYTWFRCSGKNIKVRFWYLLREYET